MFYPLSLLQESISTCRFAQRVAMIKNEAVLNEELDPSLVSVHFSLWWEVKLSNTAKICLEKLFTWSFQLPHTWDDIIVGPSRDCRGSNITPDEVFQLQVKSVHNHIFFLRCWKVQSLIMFLPTKMTIHSDLKFLSCVLYLLLIIDPLCILLTCFPHNLTFV